LRLWLRPVEGGALVERPRLTLESGRGVAGDHSYGRLRHLTLVFEDDWRAATAELAREVDPVGRRANVLLSGGGGARYVGARVRLGEAVLEIKGITRPCPVMDRAAPGLKQALEPDGRGGIWGRVVDGGAVRPGDELALLGEVANRPDRLDDSDGP
jgi:MOSC domain-containing protein YiiM